MTINWRNTNLCPIPWIHQAVQSTGDLRVCCHASHGPERGVLKDAQGNSLKAYNTDLTEARNHPLLKEIRAYMMQGKWHPECKRCQTETESGVNSRPIYENQYWIDSGLYQWNNLLNFTDSDGNINTEEIECSFYDIRLGNFCNLKCRMCGPTDSSLWYDDYAKLWDTTSYKDSHGRVEMVKNFKNKFVPVSDPYQWYEKEGYWIQMNRQMKEIKKMMIVGGEPLLIEKHYDFLQECVTNGYANNIILEYNSNCTSIPQRAFDLWKEFKEVRIGASIDGYGAVNDYIRYPSKFSHIHKNLVKLKRATGNYKVWIAATINIYNILYLPDFIEWIIDNNLFNAEDTDVRPILTPHPLHRPNFQNIRILPKDAKQYVEKNFNQKRIHLENVISKKIKDPFQKERSLNDMNKILDEYINFMWEDDYSDQLKKFWQTTRKLDQMRNLSLEKSVPELYELIKDTEK